MKFPSAAAVAICALAVALACASSAMAAGPFGIEQGAPLSKFKVVKTYGKNIFEIVPPNRNTEFASYFVYATPSLGVCKVVGYGVVLPDDLAGLSIQSKFKEVHDGLRSKYGHSKDYNFKHFESKLTAPGQYAMAIHIGDREIASFWSKENGSKMVDNVNFISLEAQSDDGVSTYLLLDYAFDNFKRCEAEAAAKDKATL